MRKESRQKTIQIRVAMTTTRDKDLNSENMKIYSDSKGFVPLNLSVFQFFCLRIFFHFNLQKKWINIYISQKPKTVAIKRFSIKNTNKK